MLNEIMMYLGYGIAIFFGIIWCGFTFVGLIHWFNERFLDGVKVWDQHRIESEIKHLVQEQRKFKQKTLELELREADLKKREYAHDL